MTKWACSLSLLVGLLASSALAKPLYITVPRSYGTEEPAVIDVAFAGNGPVELRVLRPKALSQYIAEQANLRRAYTTPPTIINPGRYLSRGLNAVDNPANFLLSAMDPALRRMLAPALPARQRAPSQRLSRLREGTKRLIGIPPNMELVRSEWLNLDLGGPDRGFDVPGFTGWGGYHSGFRERRVALSPLPAGVYVLQLVQDRVEGQVTLVVTDLSVQVKQTDGEVLVRVADRTQRPRPNAEVEIQLSSGQTLKGQTDAKGEVRLATAEPRLLITVASGADTALVDTDFYSTLAVTPDVFIYSDRPIYKPGDRVRFRGLVRKPASFLAQLFRPRKKQVTVSLVDREGAIDSTTARVDEFGSFAGSFRVSDEHETGVVQLVADVDRHEYQSEARVQAYVKPTFYLELKTEQDSIRPGEQITASIAARRYSGGVPEGTRYEVFLYRTILTTPTWVDDAGLGAEGSAVTYGSVSTTEGSLSVPVRLYSSVEERANTADDFDYSDPWASAPQIGPGGRAGITVKVPPLTEEEQKSRIPFKYLLTVRAQDPEGSTASASKPFFFADCDVQAQLASSSSFVTVGGEATLSVRALTLAGRPYGTTSGEVRFVLRSADGPERILSTDSFGTDEDGIWRAKWPASLVGTVMAEVTLKDRKSRTFHDQTKLLVVGTNGETVAAVPALTAEALARPLEPGDTARLIALFPNSWGPEGRNQGPVWITLSGNRIYSSQLVQTRGLSLVHEFPVEQRFGSAVYASIAYPTASGRWDERTVAYRIVPRERTLRVKVNPMMSEARPLTRQTIQLQVTNFRGDGVSAQVSVGVVDKAIYALQSEFRPHILSFFYPLVRNNVTNFYSAEFQGYGYGEYLARLRGRVRAHEFAAVKPPTIKRKDEDTAYWNPDVVTDRFGHASVSFSLPANQTIWTVTAVAADASGRFGEGLAEFASRGELTVATALPQFLRAGDRATGTVRVAAAKGKAKQTIHLEVTPSNAIWADGLSRNIELAAGKEEILPVQLRGAEVGLGHLALKLQTAQDIRRDSRDVPVRPATIEQQLVASRAGGGELRLEPPVGATLGPAELTLMPTAVSAALSSVRDLLNYPYGCLEQLVATTIPNIAVYRTLKAVGAREQLDPESVALLEEAYSRSVQGVARILNLSVKGGGFTWFGGYDEPTVPLTLIAVDGLTYAVNAGLVNRGDPRLVASAAYLARQQGLPPPLDATRTYVLARLQGKKQAPQVRALLNRASSADIYGAALSILAAEHAGILDEPAVRKRVATLAGDCQEQIAKVATYDFGSAFWRYPLGSVGLTAILTHAASHGAVDQKAARERFVLAMARGSSLSTFDRSTVLLHNLWLLKADAKNLQKMEPPAVSGAMLSGDGFVPRGMGLVAQLDPGTTKVVLGQFEGVAQLSAPANIPLSQAKAAESGMTLERSYWLIRPDGREPLADGGTVRQGQYVLVELELDAHDGQKYRALRSAYYVLEDAVPAGFEPVIEDKRFRSRPYDLPLTHEAMKYRSLNPERAVFFFDEPAWWSRSPRTIGYVMRAQFEGTFAAPPARLSDMYAPSVYAQTGATELTIAASRR